jgi:dienelactone hydrolase
MDRAAIAARVRAALRVAPEALRIAPEAALGAGRGLRIVGTLLLATTVLALLLPLPSLEAALGVGVATAISLGAALAAWLLTAALRRGPLSLWWGIWLIVGTVVIVLAIAGYALKGAALLALWIMAGAALLGGGVARLRTDGWAWPAGIAAFVGAAGLGALVVALALPGWRVDADPGAATRAPPPRIALPALADPGLPGPHLVRVLTYGSGRDRHRSEYAEAAALETLPVDGARMIDGWDGAAGWARTRWWGFDARALPLQGRVWYPSGDGPFPLVLIVHGNHAMEDFSDTGYAWLGRHLASRGFIAVSVDQNFLNSSAADMLGGLRGGLEGENDARGWLLLEHLRQFRTWNAVPGNPFHRRVDLGRVALVGHSRGGEAVAEAAHFNRLAHYPDDARLRFAYGFGIRAVIAIAPIDDQYDPRAQPTPMQDVSYLAIHGSHDGDVQSFAGSRQYARARFIDCTTCFKASVYLLGANHGQFNTTWGRDDAGLPWRVLLNLVPIMDAEAQRTIARALFTGFLEATLHGRREYESLFAAAPRQLPWPVDHAAGRDGTAMPSELVIDHRSGAALPVADYEEDADPATATAVGGRIAAQGLTLWRERVPDLKWDQRDSAVALLGWDRATGTRAPEYAITLGGARAPGSGARVASIGLSLAMADDSPLRDESAAWSAPATLDLSVLLTDARGRSASLPLSAIAALRAPVAVSTRKAGVLDSTPTSEPVFQRYALPLARFAGVDPTAITRITLRFDRSPAGALYVDDVDLRMETNTYTDTAATMPAVSRNGSAGTKR